MRIRQIAPISILALSTAIVPLFGQYTRTIEVNGKSVKLAIDERLMFVRPKESTKTWKSPEFKAMDWARKIVTAQAAVLEQNPKPYLLDLESKPPELISAAEGILVPRIRGIQGSHLLTLVKKVEAIESVEPVYRYEVKLKLDPESPIKSNPERPKAQSISQIILLNGTISVGFKESPAQAFLDRLQGDLGLTLIERPTYVPNVVRFGRREGSADPFTLAEKVRLRAAVKWAEADVVVQLFSVGARPANLGAMNEMPDKKWHLDRMQIPGAWKFAGPRTRIRVAVVDDGVDLNHGDLKPNLSSAGKDFYDKRKKTAQPANADAHGTACAGLIAATPNQQTGTSGGIAAKYAEILPVRICASPNNFALNPDIAKAIEYAVKVEKAKVVNLSIGGPFESSLVADALKVAAKEAVIVAASGNAFPVTDIFFPANQVECLCVGALKKNDTLWEYSCYGGSGNQVGLVAPSGDYELRGDVWSTDHSDQNGWNKGKGRTPGEPDLTGNYTARFGGTSAAAPMVSAIAAMVWSAYPHLNAQQVRQCLERSGDIVDKTNGGWVGKRSKYYGFGRVNALKALQCAQAIPVPQPKKPNADRKGKEGKISEERLKAILNPVDQVVRLNKKLYDLKPDMDYIAVLGPEGAIPLESDFWKAVDRDLVNPERPGLVVGPRDGKIIYLIHRRALQPTGKLYAAARDGGLPTILPAYECKGNSWIPNGAFTAILRKPTDMDAAVQFAKEYKLKVDGKRDGEITFELNHRSSFRNVFEAMEACERAPFVVSCEPHYYQQLK